MNSPLKLFFYSSILVNNNILLEIYCENIEVAFFNCDFFYSLYYFSFLSSIRFFLFLFSCFFSSTHVYPLLSLSTILIFLFYFIPEHILQLSFLPFLFLLNSRTFSRSLCDTSHIILLAFSFHYLQTHIDMHGKKGEIALAPPHRHRCSSSSPLLLHHTHTSLFFFS